MRNETVENIIRNLQEEHSKNPDSVEIEERLDIWTNILNNDYFYDTSAGIIYYPQKVYKDKDGDEILYGSVYYVCKRQFKTDKQIFMFGLGDAEPADYNVICFFMRDASKGYLSPRQYLDLLDAFDVQILDL